MHRHVFRAFPASLIFTSFLAICLSVFSLTEKINLGAAETALPLAHGNTQLSLAAPKPKAFLALPTVPASLLTSLSYPHAAIAKAWMLSPAAHVPDDPELRNAQLVLLDAVPEGVEGSVLYDWFGHMRSYGIFVSTIKDHLYVRFASGHELQDVYAALLFTIGEKTGLGPQIISHLIMKESAGDEAAVSSAGAAGLTQTLPIVIRELLSEKKKAGSAAAIAVRIRRLEEEISRIPDTGSGARKAKVYQNKRLAALLLIPDFTLNTPTARQAQIVEDFALLHGPLNMCFGAAHLARYKAALEYYAAIDKIDTHTDVLLASQLAYNCGLSRLSKRIRSLGGWHRIFDIPPIIEGRRAPYLPSETANYGYLFIKWYMDAAVDSESSYWLHEDEAYHYKICLGALSRSHTFSQIVKTLDSKGMVCVSGALQSRLRLLLRQGDQGILRCEDISLFLEHTRASLPEWPRVRELQAYLEVLVENTTWYSRPA